MVRLFALLLSLFALFPAPGGGAAAQDRLPAIPFLELWRASPHANVRSESFIHWDKDGAVPVQCAACHSGPGYLDFLGADGSAAGKVDRPAPVRSVVDCVTCHDPRAIELSAVLFPSGARVEGRDASNRCLVCHQGRQAGADVERAVAGRDPDAVDAGLQFINIHYAHAAAVLMGHAVSGGYEYPSKVYHGKFRHPAPFATCAGCHDPHSTRVRAETCSGCHAGAGLAAIRESAVDFDGDGDSREGIKGEIETAHRALLAAMRAYARTSNGAPIGYEPGTHPYFFADRNNDGVIGKDEAVRPNAYARWTPRLLRAAYNYQFVAKDAGAWAHNPLYTLQLLYDSLESLNARVPTGVATMMRP